MRLLRYLASVLGILGIMGAILLAGSSASHANPNDFVFESYHADYTLGQDAEGRSTLTTVETLVAEFPEHDQNRGLQRAIPHSYNGHETDLTVLSVTDETGAARPFQTWPEGEFLIVQSAVPEGQYEHGRTVYTITYTQQDVTHAFADTQADEFYWDLNGTGWAQPFGTVSATLTVEGDLGDALTGSASCYRGPEYASDPCAIEQQGSVFTVSETDIGAFENVTIAVGFTPQTFAERPEPWYANNPLLKWGGIGSGIAGFAAFVVGFVRAARGKRTGDAIIAQYEPPADMSLAVAATLVKRERWTPTATLLDLAVRGNIKLLHNREQNLFGAQLMHYEGLQSEEITFAKKLFTGKLSTTVDDSGAPLRGTRGSYLWFTRTDYTLGDAAAGLRARGQHVSRRAGYRSRPPFWPVGVLFLGLALGLGLLAFHFFGSDDSMSGIITLVFGGATAFITLIFGAVLYYTQRPLTLLGAKSRDHLEGLKLYISLAEADRLRMLQSVSGAEVTPEHVVKVYERLLPYAAMWGMEKEWQSALAKYYATTPPEWAAGDSSAWATNALVFQSLNQSVASARTTPAPVSSGGSSWSGSSGSSFSSGGSSGGGFSGGGGGGGGGRGI